MNRIAKSVVSAGAGVAVAMLGVGVASATGHGDGASAEGVAKGSPGVLSGNLIQVPIHVPVNVCGNTVNVIGLLNPVFGNACVNE
ncbi:chaplin [Streptomyces sp. NBC_01431]|uniref:chaplin n=1 Tax=Streptomyces sp. NBC_01431 TaxID=2903863 RepID=UPI002E2EA8AB|nr:chaplin [Streptomyces sp. NBC_01431]